MTVAAMRQSMSSAEYVRWSIYHGRRAQRQELEQLKAQARRR